MNGVMITFVILGALSATALAWGPVPMCPSGAIHKCPVDFTRSVMANESECEMDIHCEGHLYKTGKIQPICCPTVGGGNICKAPVRFCAELDCGPGMVCIRNEDWDMALCAVEKEEICPTNFQRKELPDSSECQTDSDCDGHLYKTGKPQPKCCPTAAGGNICKAPVRFCNNVECGCGRACVRDWEKDIAYCVLIPSKDDETATCAGNCGDKLLFGEGQYPKVQCWCDTVCHLPYFNDCCKDKDDACCTANPDEKEGYCRQFIQSYGGDDKCNCDEQCEGNKKCCLSTNNVKVCKPPAIKCEDLKCPWNQICTIKKGSPKCIDKPKNTCAGNCGGSANACWCDDMCTDYGDCCKDFDEECPDISANWGSGSSGSSGGW